MNFVVFICSFYFIQLQFIKAIKKFSASTVLFCALIRCNKLMLFTDNAGGRSDCKAHLQEVCLRLSLGHHQ